MIRKILSRFFQVVGIMTVIGLIAGVAGMYFAGIWLQVDDEPAKADLILPLAGDAHRNLHAADLYNEGFAPLIYISRAESKPPTRLHEIKKQMGWPHYDFKEYHEIFYGILGVPKEALRIFGNGHISTVEEAEALKEAVGDGPVRILLVTSPYHARRAKTIFQDVMPNADIRMTITPYETFEEKWWKDRDSAIQVVLETAKSLHYLAGGAFRSTDGNTE